MKMKGGRCCFLQLCLINASADTLKPAHKLEQTAVCVSRSNTLTDHLCFVWAVEEYFSPSCHVSVCLCVGYWMLGKPNVESVSLKILRAWETTCVCVIVFVGLLSQHVCGQNEMCVHASVNRPLNRL